MQINRCFKKEERLRHKKYIQKLFREGKTLQLSLLRLHYLLSELPTNQVMFCVPSKIVRKAVGRNAIRRKIREAYRTNKSAICDGSSPRKRFFLAYVYKAHPCRRPTYRSLLADVRLSIQYLRSMQ